jgi:hypothetical protein
LRKIFFHVFGTLMHDFSLNRSISPLKRIHTMETSKLAKFTLLPMESRWLKVTVRMMTTYRRHIAISTIKPLHMVHPFYYLPDGSLPGILTKIPSIFHQRNEQLTRSTVWTGPYHIRDQFCVFVWAGSKNNFNTVMIHFVCYTYRHRK